MLSQSAMTGRQQLLYGSPKVNVKYLSVPSLCEGGLSVSVQLLWSLNSSKVG